MGGGVTLAVVHYLIRRTWKSDKSAVNWHHWQAPGPMCPQRGVQRASEFMTGVQTVWPGMPLISYWPVGSVMRQWSLFHCSERVYWLGCVMALHLTSCGISLFLNPNFKEKHVHYYIGLQWHIWFFLSHHMISIEYVWFSWNAECKYVHAVSCSVVNDIIHIRTIAYSIQPICVCVSA